jgi:chromosome segregation ATPase
MVPAVCKLGVGAMSNRGSDTAELSIPRALNLDSKADDPVDKAGHAILGLLHQAANTAESTKQQAIETAQKLSAQLRAAEDRIRELETRVRYYEDRNDRAERWLHQISMEIEQRFFGQSDGRRSQQQAASRNQMR